MSVVQRSCLAQCNLVTCISVCGVFGAVVDMDIRSIELLRWRVNDIGFRGFVKFENSLFDIGNYQSDR